MARALDAGGRYGRNDSARVQFEAGGTGWVALKRLTVTGRAVRVDARDGVPAKRA